MTDDDGGDYLYRLMRGRADPGGLSEESDLTVIDLGHDVRVMITSRHGAGDAPVGLLESHRAPDGRECSGSVTFDVPAAEGLRGPRWTLVALDPLTLTPSVLCSCGHHGFVTNGRWVPA